MNRNLTRPTAIAVAALAAVALSGCGGGSTGSADGKTTITYANFISNNGNEKNLDTIVTAFEAENPDITVEVTTTDYANYFTTLQTDLSAGTQADVFDITPDIYSNLQADGVLAALSGVDASAYRSSVLDTYSTDGTPYALPTSFSNVVLFYNKDLFDKAGVAYPNDSWTWADEEAAAKKLTDPAAGVWGDYQPISYNEYYKTVAQAGGSFLSADGTSAQFDSAAGKRATDWLTGKSGVTMPSAADGAGTADFDSNLFKAGKLAMWHTGIWMFGALADAPFNWDIAVEPGDAQKASATFSNAVAVSNDAKNKDAAQRFATYLSSSKTMVDVRLESGWELPAISDETLLQPYLTAGKPDNRQAMFDSLEHIAVAPALGPNGQKIQDVVTNALGEIAAGRAATAETIPATATQVSGLLK